MLLHQTIILLPCHSLEDFPTHYRGSDADSLLANWTSAWHPVLISATGKQPIYRSAEDPGNIEAKSLVLIPTVAQSLAPEKFAKSVNPMVLTGHTNREELVACILAIAGMPDLIQKPDRELGEDFFALGFAFLQVQLMTRQIRGSSNLDASLFEDSLVAAATGLIGGDQTLAKTELMKCFDMLSAEKNAYYPVQPDLIDLVLTAPTTIGASFQRELETQDHPKSVLITGSLSRKLEAKAPDSFARLKSLVQADQISLIGGLDHELAEPLLSVESGVNQIQLASNSFQRQFEVESTIFARRRFGLGTHTPRLLDQFNFIGAMHCTMDAGSFPIASASNIRWESDDGSSILALAQNPTDANEGSTFLRLGVTIGRALDSAHVATVVLAHWPSKTHFCFNDLCRIRSYGNLFGQFRTLHDYFDGVYDPGYGESFSAHDYRGEYLKSSLGNGESNLISRIVDYWNRFYQHLALRVLLVQRSIGKLDDHTTLQAWLRELNELQSRIEMATEQTDEELDADLERMQTELQSNGDATSQRVVNTTSFPRTVLLRSGNHKCYLKSSQDPTRLADSTDEMTEWLVEVPAMSTTRLPSHVGSSADLARESSVVDKNYLRNEFFEVEVDLNTGGIRSIDKYDRRKNLLSQQLALRIPAANEGEQGPLSPARYTRMQSTEIQSSCPTRLSGEITTRGNLLDTIDGEETIVATFAQTLRVARGIPVVEVSVTLDSRVELTASLNHYFCSRIAWKYESADLIRSDQEASAHVIEDRFDAPNFVEIKEAADSIVLLTGGIPFHRRASRRMLDTLLVVAGETRRHFRFGLGLNPGYPLQAAIDFMTPPLISRSDRTPGWFFHFNCKNIVVTWWEPILDEDRGCVGASIRIRETQNQGGQLHIRCPRILSSARRVNFLGEQVQDLEVAENLATINFHAAEYFQFQLNWNP